MAEPENVLIIGGGEHARVVAEAALSWPKRWHVLGFFDPSPCHETVARLHIPRLGSDSDGEQWVGTGRFVLGIGAIGYAPSREQLVQAYSRAGAAWATIVHKRAWVSPSATLGEGAVVLASATVSSGAVVGAHCIVNTGAIVEHDVQVGEYSHLAPGARVGGGVHIGRHSFLGIGASVRDHIVVGDRAVIAMGAVVTASVEHDHVMAGVPARLIRRSSRP